MATLNRLYELHGEKLRFLVVGVCNTALSYAAFGVALFALQAPIAKAFGVTPRTSALIIQWAVWAVMVMVSTTTMKYFAFRSPGHLGTQIVRGYFVYLPQQGVASLILWACMRWLGLTALAGQAAAIFVTTILSYLGHKYFTFRVIS